MYISQIYYCKELHTYFVVGRYSSYTLKPHEVTPDYVNWMNNHTVTFTDKAIIWSRS